MKIGILTFHCAVNYGAVLQAFALKEYLKGLGHDVYIVDYRPKYLLSPYRVFRWDIWPKPIKDKIRHLFRELFIAPIRWKRRKVFFQFIDKYLNPYKLDLNDRLNDFDMFIFGSDQIWNKKITDGYDLVYFGDFPAAKQKKLIAYAASMGDNAPDIVDSEFLKSKFKFFDKVGVREEATTVVFNSWGITSAHVVDPVLLLGASGFRRLIINSAPKRAYLLLFTLRREDYAVPISRMIASSFGLDVIEIVSHKESVRNKNLKQSLSPLEFISYFYNASYVVTSSFHGTVFSILFEKDFITVKHKNIQMDRMESLLKSLGLLNRLISDDAVDFEKAPIDYNSVNHKCSQLRDESILFLDNVLHENQS